MMILTYSTDKIFNTGWRAFSERTVRQNHVLRIRRTVRRIRAAGEGPKSAAIFLRPALQKGPNFNRTSRKKDIFFHRRALSGTPGARRSPLCSPLEFLCGILRLLVLFFSKSARHLYLIGKSGSPKKKNCFSFHFFIFILFESSSSNEIKIWLLFLTPPCPLLTVSLEPSSKLSI